MTDKRSRPMPDANSPGRYGYQPAAAPPYRAGTGQAPAPTPPTQGSSQKK